MPVTNDDIRRAFERAQRRVEFGQLIPALMGKKTGAASWTYDVLGGRGLKYVRILQGNNEITPMQAINEAGVADTGDLPIWVRKVEGARYAIVKERFNA